MAKYFEVTTVDLSKSNLIEASAGTGKTYSIAILVLRLIIEKEIPINQILMVTFTKAAVAELEERIRKFIKNALQSVENNSETDPTIQKIIDDCFKIKGKNKVHQLLKDAHLNVDDSSVLTIHSFCQNTLTEFAFETNQLFDMVTAENIDEIIIQQINDVWRNYISVLDKDLLIKIINKLNRYAVVNYVKNVLSGKNYIRHSGIIDNIVTDNAIQKAVALNMQNDIDLINCVESIYHFILPLICNKIIDFKKKNNIITFDDMIFNLHKAVISSDNELLKKGLQQKYKAVLLDEFQDTDKYQYEIFSTVFANDSTLLFYIGDPKQSIYGFRSADIFTYFKAAESVKNQYSMNINFRSSENYIKAMNVFFNPVKSFDTFGFKNSKYKIDYIPVNSPLNNNKGELYYQNKPVTPIEICIQKNKEKVNFNLVSLVTQLLSNPDYKIVSGKTERKIKPSDIGILVRENDTGRTIKKALIKKGVYSVTIDDAKIIQTTEAKELLYILTAILHNNWSNISKALLTNFTCYHRTSIIELSEEELLLKFSHYKQIWETNGIYNSLNAFINDFNVRSYLLNNESREGIRQLSNLIQLTELLNEIEKRKIFNPQELIHWFTSNIENPTAEASGYTQRMENDEEAVKIITIHKSKGLEYNIILATELDFKNKLRDTETFRDDVTESYYFGQTSFFTSNHRSLAEEQKEQENRRLLYVAVTRAVYKAYLFSSSGASKDSTFIKFINAQQFDNSKNLVERNINNNVESYNLSFHEWRAFEPLKPNNFELKDGNWRKLSYSAISVKDEQQKKQNQSDCNNEYDKFIFKDLPKGSWCGNMLHYIFENIDFNESDTYEHVIQKSIIQYYPKYINEFKQPLYNLINHTVSTLINIDNNPFSLSQIESNKRLNEMEFDFTIPEVNLVELLKLSKPDRQILVKDLGTIKGLMNGKIDLFFEYNNKYYILDWKSNFLGDTLELYNQENVSKAMNENNYHLQYLIYTLALKKYLSKRVNGFNYNKHFGGVIYLFLRGVRNNLNSGIFTSKPSDDDIIFLEKLLSDSEIAS